MTTPTTPPATSGPDHTAVAGRRGSLYPRVALYLAGQPSALLKVGEITRALGAASSGAVFEVLKKMAAAGHATHQSNPHRFQITQAGIDAAGTPPTSTRSAARSSGRQPRPDPVTRPNGTLYYPRRLGKGWDVDVLHGLRAQNIPVLLYGPPGTGKTAMLEAAFPDLLTVAGTGDTVVDDFLGSYNPIPGGGYQFVPGPLVTAMRQGRPLLVDDATLIPPRVLAVLYPAMDGRGVITIPAHGNEHVQAVDGFYLCAGHNPGVHGAVLTEALASRFTVHLAVSTDWDLARQLGVPKAVVAAAQDLNNDLSAGRVAWAPQLRELLGFVKVRQQLGQATALANLAGIAPEDARTDVAAALARHTGTTIPALAVGTR
ncbi:AAA family ATPase [Actinoplanes sp. M2I2]|uniref:AAA family ATPase n=1 Tax=Actinoplanes sp. M2I2 TaxID=1734444 RepID=UPI0020229420|nr:AAA family ATPase [Actinoplanes sp. M2I2]